MKKLLIIFLFFINIFSFSSNDRNNVVKVTVNYGSKYRVTFVHLSTFQYPNNFYIIREEF